MRLADGRADVCCDWLSLRHDYAHDVGARESGRVMKIDKEGVVEWENQSWEDVRCPSSDTSLRVKCDGRRLHASGNIGRFQHSDNVTGMGVMGCVERWAEVLGRLGFDLGGFGTRDRAGTVAECGTTLTRVDLAGNFEVSDYSALSSALMVRRIGQRLPMAGRYGPTWGYDAKRANWWKAKLYDKSAEAAGKRRSEGGETLARFEVQLGSEWLKQRGRDNVAAWKDADMGNVIYGGFADAVFRESVSVEDWSTIPVRLRHWAVLWRDGADVRTMMSSSAYYRARARLLEYGLDVGAPCNVTALVRRARVVEVRQVSALRAA